MTLIGAIAIVDQIIPVATLIFNYFKNRAKEKQALQISSVQPK
jgi:hypothetical protein